MNVLWLVLALLKRIEFREQESNLRLPIQSQACCHYTTRTDGYACGGRVRVAREVEAVAFAQIGRCGYLSHF